MTHVALNRMIRITILVDNAACVAGLKIEHGLAFWIETEHGRVLFDTGQGIALTDNAQALNIDLAQADAIALSHGHYDHTGGLDQAWLDPARTPVYLHPAGLNPRYRVTAEAIKEIGMPGPVRALLARNAACVRHVLVPTEILPGVWLTGPVPRRHPEEDLDREQFFLDPHGKQPDPFEDDLAMYLPTRSGVIVLLGCAHAGVINTLDHIRQLTGGATMVAVIGGMHLRSAGRPRLDWTVARLQEHSPGMIGPVHCTGDAAATALANAFGTRYRPGGAGAVFTFESGAQTPTRNAKHVC